MPIATPLYGQVEQDLCNQIFSGKLAAGTLLMSEGEMCQRYEVSRITVRRAVEELVRKGLLYRRRGIGTFVIDPKQHQKAVMLSGYIEDILPFNQLRLLKSDRAALPPAMAEMLPGKPETQWRRFVSVNHIDKKPFSYAQFFFPDDVSDLLHADDFSLPRPPIRIIEERSGRRVLRALQRIHADVADAEIARHLRVKPKMPLLRITRIYFSAGGAPLEGVQAHYHPERYSFTVELLPRQSATIESPLEPVQDKKRK